MIFIIYLDVSLRWRIEDAGPQTFTCYLSQMTEFDEKSSFFKRGNAPDKYKFRWGHVYLPDMAKATGFKNEDVTKLAVLENVNLNTPLDEKNPKTYDNTLNEDEEYPYKKTRAGALQMKKMPWDYEAERKNWINLGLISTGIGIAFKTLI